MLMMMMCGVYSKGKFILLKHINSFNFGFFIETPIKVHLTLRIVAVELSIDQEGLGFESMNLSY